MPPKKSKKGKSGKGKKKGSKTGKKVAKVDTDDVVQQAIANACLWQSRLGSTEAAKNEYRDNTRTLLRENEKLQVQVSQTEKDTIEVISFLKLEDMKKDEKITKYQAMLKELKKDYKKEKQNLINEYTTNIEVLQTSLAERTNEVRLLQAELDQVKDFRRKRVEMQKELDDIKENLTTKDKDHHESLEKVERKFFEEKIHLQDEASRKISELAERAHTEAVSNLDETTRSIYKENVRLTEDLNYHVKYGEDLAVTKKNLSVENKKLKSEKEMNSLIVEEKVVQGKKLQKQVRELNEKNSNLEHTLAQVIKENECEKNELSVVHHSNEEHNKMEIARLNRAVELKTKEMNRVKKLAKHILDQRSEMENFFLESLEYVKAEITRNRLQYRRDAESAYHQRVRAAHVGQAEYPKIRTFKNTKHSTNTIFSDLKEAEKWEGFDSTVEMSDLTWEQRERVLRLMFAKMNGCSEKKVERSNHLPPINTEKRESLTITNGGVDDTLLPSQLSAEKAFMTDG